MDKFRNEIHRVIDSRDLDPVQIQVDDNSFYIIKNDLEKIAQVVKVSSEYHAQQHQHDRNSHNINNNK